MLGIGKMRIALDALRAIRRPLFESAASLNRQLAALHQRCGCDSSSRAVTAAQLQVTWAALVGVLAPVRMRQGLPWDELVAFHKQAARDLLALQPDNPRSSYELGKAAFNDVRAGLANLASRRRDVLPHFQRGAELARAQGSDFWLARCAGC